MAATLKLLVDINSKKVVYAEAGKEFVDFLLGLMELPLASILRLLHKSDQIGDLSLGKVYQSARFIDGSYLQDDELRYHVINPICTPYSKVKQTSVLQSLVPGAQESYTNY
ncbi:Cyclin-D1-binding protein 1-like protein [Bienertia sinuspersici]